MPIPEYRAVLLIDDEEDFREALATALRRRGFVVVAVSSTQAIKGISYGVRFDAVVTDVFMPDVDGLEIIAAARKHQENVPVIAMSGDQKVYDGHLEVARKLGAVRTLVKPFELEELFEAVESAISESRGS